MKPVPGSTAIVESDDSSESSQDMSLECVSDSDLRGAQVADSISEPDFRYSGVVLTAVFYQVRGRGPVLSVDRPGFWEREAGACLLRALPW